MISEAKIPLKYQKIHSHRSHYQNNLINATQNRFNEVEVNAYKSIIEDY